MLGVILVCLLGVAFVVDLCFDGILIMCPSHNDKGHPCIRVRWHSGSHECLHATWARERRKA